MGRDSDSDFEPGSAGRGSDSEPSSAGEDSDHAPARRARRAGGRAAAAGPSRAPRPAKRAAAAGASADGDEGTFPFDRLPAEAQDAVCLALTSLSLIDTVENVARDVFALAGTSRALRSLAAEVLWPSLATRLAPPEGAEPCAPELGAPKALRHEEVHFRIYPDSFDDLYETWDIGPPPSAAAVRAAFERRPETAAMPLRVFAEVRRARMVGMSEAKGKALYGLTDGDLRALAAGWMAPRLVLGRPPLTMRLRPVAAIAAAARARYVTAAALEAALAARAEAKAHRERERREREAAAPGGRAGAEAARRAAKAEAAAQVLAWLSASTEYDRILAAGGAPAHVAARRKLASDARIEAVAEHVAGRHGGDVNAAVAAAAGAPGAKSIAAVLRGVWRSVSGAFGGGGASSGSE